MSDERTDPAEEPTRVTIGPILAPAPPRSRSPGERSQHGRELERRTAALVPLAIAAPALVLPLAWPFVCIALVTVLGVRRRLRDDGDLASVPAAVFATLGAGLARIGRALVPPGLIGSLFGIAGAVVVAVVVGAGLPAMWWLANHGSDGAVVAARLGAYAHTPAILSFILCWVLLRDRRANNKNGDPLSSALGRASDGTLAGIAAALSCVLLFCAFALPTATFWPGHSFADATSILPGAARDLLLDAQLDLVDTEAQAVLDCLRSHEPDAGWLARDSIRSDDDTIEVRIGRVRHATHRATRRDLSVLVLALYNQLPGAVTTISIRRRPDLEPIVIDRSRVERSGPTTDTDELARAAGVGPEALPTSPQTVSAALRCGAAAI